jgi:toxin ParE1/3/4
MKFVVSNAAQYEIDNAADHYELESPGLGFDFISELQAAFALLQEQHYSGRLVEVDAYLQLREYVLRRFPYCIVYDIHNDEMAIVAIAHQSRRQRYWQNRVQEESAVYQLAA